VPSFAPILRVSLELDDKFFLIDQGAAGQVGFDELAAQETENSWIIIVFNSSSQDASGVAGHFAG